MSGVTEAAAVQNSFPSTEITSSLTLRIISLSSANLEVQSTAGSLYNGNN